MGILDRVFGRAKKPLVLGGGDDLEVVGEASYQPALLRISGGRNDMGVNRPNVVAVLEAEPDNPYDRKAVAVKVNGHKVGHLPKAIAAKYQPAVIHLTQEHGRPIALHGTLVGGWDRGDGDIGNIGLWLRHNPSDFT